MSRTVDELRNEIRKSVGRFERVESTSFTKEDLAAICETVDYDIDTDHLPPTAQMRAGILWRTGEIDADDPDKVGNSFRKAELKSVSEALQDE